MTISSTKILFLTFVVVIIISFNCFGQEPSPANYNSFDGLNPGAKPLSMGYAFTSFGEDPSALFYNPASLSLIKFNAISMTFEVARQSDLGYDEIIKNESLRNQNLIFLTLAGKKGSFSWMPLANKVFKKIQGNDLQETEIKLNAYTISACHQNNPNFYTGLSLSYLNGRIGTAGISNNIPFVNISDGNGFTSDFGILYQASEIMRLGISLKNIFGFVWWDDYDKDQLPFCLRGGFSFQINKFFSFCSDFEKRFYRKDGQGETQSSNFGIEQNIGKILSLRAGMFGSDLSDKDKTHFTAGIGYQISNCSLSIAGEKYRISNLDVFRYVFSLDIPL